MYAITIRQPWASLIMAGIKTLETRSRATNIRGRVLIHSALKPEFTGSYQNIEVGIRKYIKELKEAAGHLGHNDDFYRSLPLGKILGSVDLTDCLPAGDWLEVHKGKGNFERHEIYDREFTLGNLSSDRFVWVLKDPQPWPDPFPVKGKQGFWNFQRDMTDYFLKNNLL